MIPPPLYTRAIVLRAAGLWLGVRLVIAAIGLPALTLFLPIGPTESTLIIGIALLLAMREFHLRGEWLLLANLGSSAETALLLSAAPVVPLETAFTLLILALR